MMLDQLTFHQLLWLVPVAMALLAGMSLKIGHVIANQTLQRGEK